MLLYPITAWIGLSVANLEDPAQRTVIVAAAGGPGVVTVATLLAALVVSLPLAGAGVLLPAVVNPPASGKPGQPNSGRGRRLPLTDGVIGLRQVDGMAVCIV